MARGKSVKPIVARLNELQPGDYADFFAQLIEKSRGTTREGKPYYHCRFRDGERIVSLMVWADSPTFADCDLEWTLSHFYKLRASYGEHERYGPQIELDNIRVVNDGDYQAGFDPASLRPPSRFDPVQQWQSLVTLIETEIRDDAVRQLLSDLLVPHMSRWQELPATPRHYYPYPGGWLDHTLTTARHAAWLADRYLELYPQAAPPLNRDLIVAGTLLHELGRIDELSATDPPEPTIPGRLLGHMVLGRDRLRQAAAAIPTLSGEFVMLLEHVMLSYLQLPEWGSPRLPAIPEVLIVHHVVDLDAKLEMYLRVLKRDTGAGPFTERDPILGRILLRDRKE